MLISAGTPAQATPDSLAQAEEFSYRDGYSRRARGRMSTIATARRLPTPARRALIRSGSGGAL